MENEYQQGKNAIDAAKEVCIQLCLKCEQVVMLAQEGSLFAHRLPLHCLVMLFTA